MNLPYLLERHAGQDCRRIDLMIGETTWWVRGVGGEMVEAIGQPEGMKAKTAYDVQLTREGYLAGTFRRDAAQPGAAVSQARRG